MGIFLFKIRFKIDKISTSLNDKRFIEDQKNILRSLSNVTSRIYNNLDISSDFIKRKIVNSYYIVNEFYAVVVSYEIFKIIKINSKITYSFANSRLRLKGTEVLSSDKIISKSRLYSNKDGSKDKRRKYNYEVFDVIRYYLNINLFGLETLTYNVNENSVSNFRLSFYKKDLSEFKKNNLVEKLYSKDTFNQIFVKFSKNNKNISFSEFLMNVQYHLIDGYYISNEYNDFADYILHGNCEGDVVKIDSSITSSAYQISFIQLINNFSLFKINDLEYINTKISPRLSKKELLDIKKDLEDNVKILGFVSLFRFAKMNPQAEKIITTFGLKSFIEFLELIPSITINKDFLGGILITPINARYTNGSIISKIFRLLNKSCINVYDLSELILNEYGFKISGDKLLNYLKNQNLFVFGDYVAVDKESYMGKF